MYNRENKSATSYRNIILSRESIGRSHVNSLFYPSPNIIFLAEQPPSGLPVAEILGLFEISQILVVHYYGYRMLSTSEIVVPLL